MQVIKMAIDKNYYIANSSEINQGCSITHKYTPLYAYLLFI